MNYGYIFIFLCLTILIATLRFWGRKKDLTVSDADTVTEVAFISRTSDVEGSYFVRGTDGAEAVVPLKSIYKDTDIDEDYILGKVNGRYVLFVKNGRDNRAA